MKALKDIKVLCCDNGLFVEHAMRLARDCKKVYYCTPGGLQSAFPKMNDMLIGKGIPEIEVVESVFGPHFDSVDLFFFPDVNYGALQVQLVKMGKTVWGSRLGEEMELSREGMKELMRYYKLPVGRYELVKGLAALRVYLKENKNRWVKVDVYRGTFETFFAKNYKSVEPLLDEIEHNLGAFKYVIEFIVEDDLPDKVELGTDRYTIDGKLTKKGLAGIEVKDRAYVMIFTEFDKIPEPVTRFERVLAPVFEEYGYRGFFSTEVRIGKDHVPYMIDACMRCGSPPGELFQEMYTNYSDIIWKGANGILVEPEPVAKYGAEVLINSQWADKNWQEISFPKEFRRNIKFRNAMIINGAHYVIPQSVGLPEVGAVVAWGNTMEDAIERCKEIASTVEGYDVEIPVEAFDKANEEIEKSAKWGLSYF